MTEQKRSRAEAHKRKAKPKSEKPPKQRKGIVKKIILAIVTLGILTLVAGAGLFAYYVSSAPELDEKLLKDPLSSVFHDKNGDVFATIGAENREYVKYEDIPQEMIDAIIATEDVRFFEHSGMDFYRLGGAILANVTRGFGAEGASTITQQVVKNSFLQNEKKLKRKAQEAWLAFKLERAYAKEEIFEMYFNKVLMSGRIYGFGTGAKYFYNKELVDLTLPERALLAGMPQAPNGYNPLKFPEDAKFRRDIVLGLMAQHGKITEAQMKEAKQASVTDGLTTEEQRLAVVGSKYDAFLDVVIGELEANGESTALAEGITVYTTLDPQAQQKVEGVMNNDELFPTEKIQSGISVIDTTTGAIQAIGGGRHYGAERGFNYATDSIQQPGSTMKPLTDYGPAIEYKNWSTGHALVDKPTTYTGGASVNNVDMNYLGTLTMRQALYMSRNTTAVQTFQEVGAERSLDFIKGLGITPKEGYLVESDALGGGMANVSTTQLAGAYAAFGNEGVFNQPYAIEKIVYRDGVTEKSFKPKSNVAMSDYTAYMITDMLRDVVSDKPGSSGSRANVPGIDVAGKTGTTNYSDDELRTYGLASDAVPETWFAGYTTQYSVAIWSGYEKRSDAMTTWEERWLPQVLFSEVMGSISDNPDRFTKPNSVVEATIEVGTNPVKLASAATPAEKRRTELFVKGAEPTEVSTNYEVEEKEDTLEAPGVSASINEAGQIAISWSHSSDDASFEVALDGMNLTTTKERSFTVANPGTADSYTVTVVAIVDGKRSPAGSATVTVSAPEPEEPTEPEQPEEPEEQEPPAEPEQPTEQEPEDNGTTTPTNPNGNNDGSTNPNPPNGNGNNNGNGSTTPPTTPTAPKPPESQGQSQPQQPPQTQ